MLNTMKTKHPLEQNLWTIILNATIPSRCKTCHLHSSHYMKLQICPSSVNMHSYGRCKVQNQFELCQWFQNEQSCTELHIVTFKVCIDTYILHPL